jgi:hypothetical protein
MRMLNLYNANGSSIESVQVTVRVGNMAGQLQLMADGYIEDSQNINSMMVSLNPRRNLVIGQNLRMLSLSARGRVYVERIGVYLSDAYSPQPQPPYPGPYPQPVPPPPPPPYPNPGPFPPGPGNGGDTVATAYIGQNYFAPAGIDLTQATSLMNYRGYRIVSVTVYGAALNSYQAGLRIMANNMVLGNLILSNNGAPAMVAAPAQMIVGQNVVSLNLWIDTPARIDRVEVRLSRF